MAQAKPVTHEVAEWVVLDKPGVELHYVPLTFRAFEADDGDAKYESVCDELDVSSCGNTLDEALNNVVDATLLYLNTLEDLGERRRVFDEREIDFERVRLRTASSADRPRKVDVLPGHTVQRHTLALQ